MAKGDATLALAAKQVAAGGCAGAITKTSVAPLERIKIIMQVQGMNGEQSSGLVATMRQVVQEEGVLSLWRSNGVNW